MSEPQTPEAAAQALAQIVRAADWSSQFGITEALEDIDDAQTALRKSVALNSTEGEAVRVAIAALEAVRSNSVCMSARNPPIFTGMMDAVNGPTYVVYGTTMNKVEAALTALRRSGEGV